MQISKKTGEEIIDNILIEERSEYIYLIHTADFAVKNIPVYKIGRTSNIRARFNSYPRKSIIYYVCRVNNSGSVEDNIKKNFRDKFTLEKGSEYFKGKKSDMILCINKVIDLMNQRIDGNNIDAIIKRCYRNRHQIKIDDTTDIIYDYDGNGTEKDEIEDNCENIQLINNNTSLNDANVNMLMIHNKGTQNIKNDIFITKHGKEDMSKIDINDIVKCIDNISDIHLKLIEMIHFNQKYPEFQNVYISNIKNEYAMKYNKSWDLCHKKDTIDKLYIKVKKYIGKNIDILNNLLSDSQKKDLQKWVELNKASGYIKKLKIEIKLLLYNKRQIIMNTRNKMEGNI